MQGFPRVHGFVKRAGDGFLVDVWFQKKRGPHSVLLMGKPVSSEDEGRAIVAARAEALGVLRPNVAVQVTSTH